MIFNRRNENCRLIVCIGSIVFIPLVFRCVFLKNALIYIFWRKLLNVNPLLRGLVGATQFPVYEYASDKRHTWTVFRINETNFFPFPDKCLKKKIITNFYGYWLITFYDINYITFKTFTVCVYYYLLILGFGESTYETKGHCLPSFLKPITYICKFIFEIHILFLQWLLIYRQPTNIRKIQKFSVWSRRHAVINH